MFDSGAPHEANYLISNFDTITYTFDPNYIHSMSDWYDKELCEHHDGDLWEDFFAQYTTGYYTFIVNNLIIDSYTFTGQRNQPYYIAWSNTFICNNCQFRDIIINATHHDIPNDDIADQRATLIYAANVELNNCTIDNITYIPSSSDIYDLYNYDHSFITINSTNTLSIDSGSFSVSITNNNIIGPSHCLFGKFI